MTMLVASRPSSWHASTKLARRNTCRVFSISSVSRNLGGHHGEDGLHGRGRWHPWCGRPERRPGRTSPPRLSAGRPASPPCRRWKRRRSRRLHVAPPLGCSGREGWRGRSVPGWPLLRHRGSARAASHVKGRCSWSVIGDRPSLGHAQRFSLSILAQNAGICLHCFPMVCLRNHAGRLFGEQQIVDTEGSHDTKRVDFSHSAKQRSWSDRGRRRGNRIAAVRGGDEGWRHWIPSVLLATVVAWLGVPVGMVAASASARPAPISTLSAPVLRRPQF